MSAAHIDDVLALTGRLDDSTIEDPARERFRAYLVENVNDPVLLRNYIDQCRERTDEQHARALRDLINHYGKLLGFDVTFGPYEWLPGQVGFDGRWISPWGLHIVVEVKSRETFAAQRPSLARSVERLIADGVIPNWTLALGLYVVAHPDLQVNHLEKAILDEKQTHQIRLITPESLFTLAVLQSRGQLSQQDVLTLLRSSSPAADWLVELVSRLSNGTALVGLADTAAAAATPPGDTSPPLPEVPPPAPGDNDGAVAEESKAEPVTEHAEPERPEPEPAAERAASEPTFEASQPEPSVEELEAERAGSEPTPEPGEPEPSVEELEAEPEPTQEEAEAEPAAAQAEAKTTSARAAAAPPPPEPVDLAEVLECFGNCVVRTLEMVLRKRLQ
ncbi:MAG: hypothetical protein PVJ43_07970 [Gemmatimonadales bacterium]|jgi:hypothetical protein